MDVSPFWFFFTGKAHTHNSVTQWPDEVYSTPGGNISIHCHTEGDIQEAACLVNWFYKRDEIEKHEHIDNIAQFSGRHSEEANHSRSSFSLTSLELNDTGMFLCNYICRIYGTYEQHYGNGTRLFVHFRTENVTQGSPFYTSNITGKKEDNLASTLCKIAVELLCFGSISHYHSLVLWPDGVEDESRVDLIFPFLVLIVLLSKLVAFIFMSSVALFSPH